GAGVVGLVAEDAVELGGMADRFVNGQVGVGGVEDEVVLAGLDRFRAVHLLGLLGGGDRVLQHVVAVLVARGDAGDLVGRLGVEVLPTHAHRRREGGAG